VHNPQTADIFSLKDRLAIITGGGTGLGFAMASCFVASGARVIITGRRADVLQAAAKQLGPNAFAEQHDVTDLEISASLLERIEARHGLPTILINNAGTHVKKRVEEHTIADFHSILATHVEGAFAMTRATVPLMKRAGLGSIIFTASMSSLIGLPNIVGYSAAKAGVLALTRVAAAENGPHGVRVNAITPGLIYNDFLRKIYPEEFFDGYAESRSLVGRIGQPEDVANLVAFLVSDQAGYVTGEVYGVSGGVYPHG